MGIQNWSDEIILVKLAKEPAMGEELLTTIDMVKQKGNCGVVIDFCDIDIMSSSSIAKLLKLRKTIADCGGGLIFCGVAPNTMQIFSITGLEKVFKFADDQFVALASLQMV